MVVLENGVFVPCRKQVVLTKIGENSDFAFYPQKQGASLLRPRKSMKMRKWRVSPRQNDRCQKHRPDNPKNMQMSRFIVMGLMCGTLTEVMFNHLNSSIPTSIIELKARPLTGTGCPSQPRQNKRLHEAKRSKSVKRHLSQTPP